MEHLSEVIPHVMNRRSHAVHGGAILPAGRGATVPTTGLTNLRELAARFEEDEQRDNPDLVTAISTMRFTPEGLIELRTLGAFAMTGWALSQLGTILGIRWNRWSENATAEDEADEVNRRLKRATGTIRVRTRAFGPGDPRAGGGAKGELRAFVSPGYSPVSDARLARHLAGVLGASDHELRLIRYDLTDKTTSYVVKLGDAYRPGDKNAEVGDVWGGILVRNSGVGFASLLLSLHLTRILCLNGLTAPVPDALLLKRRHRGIEDSALGELLSSKLADVGQRLHQGQARLRAAVERRIADVRDALSDILENARLPQRLLPPILEAYNKEASPTAFGLSQAMTLAAQTMSPEERLDLEAAAGNYLRDLPN